MSQGRMSLEQVIREYEKQRADAMRIKQEAEIVLPFLRAAVEELESNVAEGEAHARRAVSRARDEDEQLQEHAAAERRSSAAVFGVSGDGEEADESEEAAQGRRAGFGRPSIAALIDEAGKAKKKNTG